MDDELTPEQKVAAENPETMVPRNLIEGREPADIAAELARLDWSPQAAYSLVTRVQKDLRRFNESRECREQLINEACKQFLAGLFLAFFAVGFTGLMLLAVPTEAIHVLLVAIGFFLGALVLANRGRSRWRFYRGDTLRISGSDSDVG